MVSELLGTHTSLPNVELLMNSARQDIRELHQRSSRQKTTELHQYRSRHYTVALQNHDSQDIKLLYSKNLIRVKILLNSTIALRV